MQLMYAGLIGFSERFHLPTSPHGGIGTMYCWTHGVAHCGDGLAIFCGEKTMTSHLGRYFYAGAAIALGLIGLVWSDFATNWQRVALTLPHHTLLADTTALCELAAGVALLWPRSARVGAGALTALYAVFALLWIPKILEAPKVYDGWGNFFEESSLVISGLVLYSLLTPSGSFWSHKTGVISRLYGICALSFALDHIVSFSAIPAWVPRWIPPGQIFWAAATTVFFLMAAVSILTGVLAPLASRLLAVMIAGFELFVWLPKLFSTPHDHFSWAGNGISLAMTAAAWVVADSIAANTQR